MGLSAQQWWQEWQLRVLVLGSLFVQFLLCFTAVLRKRAIPSWIRFIIWFSYVGGDALAIYALATLFDRNKHQAAGDRGMSTLELIWAPVLLIHLGGHPNITAYSLEDNLQWKQQAIIVISKVTITLYVFIKWWSGEKKLWRASFLLFVFAIAKFAQKPLALWSASYDTIVASMARSRPITETSKISCEEYVRQAKKCVQDRAAIPNNQAELDIRNFPLTLYADLPASYSGRVSTLRYLLQLNEAQAYKLLQKCQGDTFMILYSKFKGIAMYRRYLALHLLLTVPVFAFLGIFAKVHKDGYKKNDVTVTYILLSCTAVLEVLSLYSAPIVYALTTWHVLVPQYSLISFHHLKKSTCLMNLATFKVVQMYLYEHRYAKRINAASRLTQLVRQHVKDGWDSYIHDTVSYRVFNNCRGQWTLHRKILGGDNQRRQSLEWSLNLPFDESVLLWHIATELCFRRQNISSPQGREGEAVQEKQGGREISNYMVYLFCVHPEMLISGARSSLLPVASDAIELIMKEIPGQLHTEDSIAQDIISPDTRNSDVKLSIKDSPARVNTTQVIAQNYIAPEIRNRETLSHDAGRLANALMDLDDEKHRWGLIQGVWVEMLCYSAARCKGYLHAKSLGDGGEYLSYVWLLWSFMGMEILSDKIQRPEPPGEGEIAAAGVVPSSSRAHGDR